MRKIEEPSLLFFLRTRHWKLLAIKRRLSFLALQIGVGSSSSVSEIVYKKTIDYDTYTNSSISSNLLVKTEDCRNVPQQARIKFQFRELLWDA